MAPANAFGRLPATASTINARTNGDVEGMLETVPVGRPCPIVAEAVAPGVSVMVAVVVAVVTTVVVRIVDVMTVWGGLLITKEFSPPRKLKIVDAE